MFETNKQLIVEIITTNISVIILEGEYAWAKKLW